MQVKKNAVCRVRGTRDGVDRSGFGAARPSLRRRIEAKERSLVQGGICRPLEETVKATDTDGTGLSLQNRYGPMLAELFRKVVMQSLAECVREFISVEERREYDGDISIEAVNPVFVGGGFCLLSNYDRSQNMTETSETGGSLLHEQRVYVSCESDAER